jgi:rod shape determining protein RodA
MFLIFIEPDLGTTLVTLFCALSIVFFEGLRWRTVFLAVGLVALIVPLGWRFFIHDYQRDRVRVWLDSGALQAEYESAKKALKQRPEDPELVVHVKELNEVLAKAYQPKQAEIAIGSGGFYGKGGQNGHADRQRGLPELHTDFVIACYGEERGFVGSSFLLTLYYLLCYWCIRVTKLARDRYQVLVAVGVCALIFWQFFVNVGMVTGLMPVVGVTLPLLSYGGSSVITICIGLGLLFNIVFRRRATG